MWGVGNPSSKWFPFGFPGKKKKKTIQTRVPSKRKTHPDRIGAIGPKVAALVSLLSLQTRTKRGLLSRKGFLTPTKKGVISKRRTKDVLATAFRSFIWVASIKAGSQQPVAYQRTERNGSSKNPPCLAWIPGSTALLKPRPWRYVTHI